jgi:hypothetical protein
MQRLLFSLNNGEEFKKRRGGGFWKEGNGHKCLHLYRVILDSPLGNTNPHK